MARRKPAAPPATAGGDPRRHAWTIATIRIRGWQALPVDRRQSWLTAWRQFARLEGPCPVPLAAFDRAVETWPTVDVGPLVAGW
jgi:hypothetical protein